MKIKLTILASFLITSINTYCQQIGDGFAPTNLTDFTLPLNSGLYGSPNPIGSTPDTSHPWQHLFVIRHGNSNNNHQLQIGSAFATNDRLFFRKIAGGLEAMNPSWIELATRGANSFVGDQSISGNVGIGTATPEVKLDVLSTNVAAFFRSTSNTVPVSIINSGSSISTIGFKGSTSATAYNVRVGADGNDFIAYTNNVERMRLTSDGNLGIGTINPTKLLDIQNSNGGVGESYIWIKKGIDATNVKREAGIILGTNAGDYGNTFKIAAMSSTSYFDEPKLNFKYTNPGGGQIIDLLTIDSFGNVGIGTTNPTSKLTVAGNINSREVKVTVDAGADFVFEKAYHLPSLASLDAYIKENKHLPEIASAKEMQANGINLSEMNIKLLQKIEELTLYTIEQNKKLEQQNAQLQLQNEKMLSLEKKVEKLELHSK